MKRIGFLFTCMLFCFSIAFAQEKTDISFSETTYDFGKIKEENGDATHEFTITNKGKTPLVLNKVTASCGCTTPNWTKEPIAPGKTGFVKATYGAKGRPGMFTKTVSVYSNLQEAPFILTIKGEVIPKPQEEPAATSPAAAPVKVQ